MNPLTFSAQKQVEPFVCEYLKKHKDLSSAIEAFKEKQRRKHEEQDYMSLKLSTRNMIKRLNDDTDLLSRAEIVQIAKEMEKHPKR